MGRAKRIISSIHPYHITARCINKDWFRIPIEDVWQIFSDHLYFCHRAFGARIHAFDLMNNHFHMMMTTPDANISEIMHHFMGNSSKEITGRSGRINQTFGGPYYASLITNDIYYMHAYKYLYRNPVEGGLCLRVEDYKFSTLNALLGFSKCTIPLAEDNILFDNIAETLKWLNTPYRDGVKEQIRTCIKKHTFKFANDPVTRKRNVLEKELS